MSVAPVPRLDRRHRRRQETIEEVLDVAAEVMAEQGVAGLSLGEVARRMGIRPPSLYVYFDSKAALYDALFTRGWESVGALMEQAYGDLLSDVAGSDDVARDAESRLRGFAERFVRWALENPAYSPLMFWRPVPGFEPSPEAYRPALALVQRSRDAFGRLRDAGALRADVDLEQALRDWTVLITGVITQQLANAPDEPAESGRFTAAIPSLVAMFLDHYGPIPPAEPPRRPS